MKIACDNPVEVAKEMFWLAWNACGGPLGFGVLQDRPTATKDDVWKAVSGEIATDYIVPQGDKLSVITLWGLCIWSNDEVRCYHC